MTMNKEPKKSEDLLEREPESVKEDRQLLQKGKEIRNRIILENRS